MGPRLHQLFPAISLTLLTCAVFASAINPTDLKAYSKFLPGSAPAFDDQPVESASRIDNSIDPDAYFIGGGDVFQISVVDLPSIRYTGTVNENCDVYIPELGIIKIGKETLSRARKEIADFVAGKLRKHGEVYVSLVNTKTAVLTVDGDVANPGTYRIAGTDRLLDAIRQANGGVLPSYNEYNYREVVCRNRDSIQVFDLFRYLFGNRPDQNPYVYPGDNIRISLAQRRVVVEGAVESKLTGWVPIRHNEQAADLLSMIAFDESADSDHIAIQRTNADNSSSSVLFSLHRPVSFALKDHDLIIVSGKENYPQVVTVSARGEFVRPGMYPLVQNVTKAEDIVHEAGGPTTIGNPDRAYVIRHIKIMSEEVKQNPNSLRQEITTGLVDNSVRPEINAALFRMNASNDFSVLRFSDNKNGIILEPGDEVVIPKREYSVYVSGSVRSPGAYPFTAGFDKDHYIDLAGGYSSKADKTNSFVVTYYGEVMQIRGNGAVQEGDVVVVPDSQQFKFLTMVLIPIISAVAITISTILALYTNVHL